MKASLRASCTVFLQTPLKAVGVFAVLSGFCLAKPQFTELQYNKHWYRTYDSTSDILPDKGELLFNWVYMDSAHQPDSFYVGIDTLWSLPQNMNADTNEDWDLQVCPDGFCITGLSEGIHGGNAIDPFGPGRFQTEHHFEFFPAISPTDFHFTGPPGAIFGALMFARSRSTGETDTVLGFGSWKVPWDTEYPPPVRPVDGYLPKKSDFVLSNGAIRYEKGASGIAVHPQRGLADANFSSQSLPGGRGFSFAFPYTLGQKKVEVFDARGRFIWSSGWLASGANSIAWDGSTSRSQAAHGDLLFARLTWKGNSLLLRLFPSAF